MRNLRRGFGALIAAVLVITAVVAFATAASGGWAVDYLAFATGGRLLLANPHHLYDVAAQGSEQMALLGYHVAPNPHFPALFVNPPFVAALIAPLAQSRLQTGTDLFCAALLLCMAWTALLVGKRVDCGGISFRRITAVLVGISASASYAVLLGQWSPIMLLLALVVLFLIEGQRPQPAGMLLALLWIKPQVMWLVPLGFLVFWRWRFLAGFAIGSAVVWCVSLLLVGVDGMAAYFQLLGGFVRGDAGNTQSLAGMLVRVTSQPGLINVFALVFGAIVLTAMALLGRRYHPSDAQLFAVLLLLSALTAPHLQLQDLALLGITAVVFVRSYPGHVTTLLAALNLAALPTFVWGIPVAGAVVAIAAAVALQATLIERRRLTAASVA